MSDSGRVVREPDRVVVPVNRAKMALVLLGSLAFVTVGAVMVVVADLLVKIVGLIAILFFALGVVFAASRVLTPKPAVIIDEEGVHDYASVVSAGLVQWAEITAYWATSEYGKPQVCIHVEDPEALVSRAAAWRRPIMRMNMKMSGTSVFIPQMALPITAEELVTEISRMRGTGSQVL